MTSLFEPGVPAVSELVLRLGREVSPLEFFSVAVPEKTDVAAAADGEALAAEARARQMTVMVDAAREAAVAATREEMRVKLEERLAEERARVEMICDAFGGARLEYFRAAEVEVVRLALAIAKRVLGREVAADGVALAGIARAALAKVQDGSSCALRVPGGGGAWREALGKAEVEVVEDDRLSEGRVVLETGVGCVELGIREQMAEVERGFGELMRGGMVVGGEVATARANADSLRE